MSGFVGRTELGPRATKPLRRTPYRQSAGNTEIRTRRLEMLGPVLWPSFRSVH